MVKSVKIFDNYDNLTSLVEFKVYLSANLDLRLTINELNDLQKNLSVKTLRLFYFSYS